MSKTIVNCPDCGHPLELTIQVTAADAEPDNSLIEFYCAGDCKTQHEDKESTRLCFGIPKYYIKVPEIEGKSFNEKQDFLLELARQYVVNDSSIRERQRAITACR